MTEKVKYNTQQGGNLRAVPETSNRSKTQFIVVNNDIEIGNNYVPVPKEYWVAVVNLFIYYSKLKVECLTYLNKDIHTGEYLVTVPRQSVTMYRIQVKDQLNQVDLLTGKPVRKAVVKYGSIHSHHSMSPEFSTYDDQSDFNNPPGIHIVVGNYPELLINCSIVVNSKRYPIAFTKLFTPNTPAQIKYNPQIPDNVIKQIILPNN